MFLYVIKNRFAVSIGRVFEVAILPNTTITGIVAECDEDNDMGIAFVIFGYGIAFGYSPQGNYR